MSKNINNLLIPNVTKAPGQRKVDVSNRLPKEGKVSDFKNLLDEQIGAGKPLHGGISLSTHAAKRLEERKIDFNGDEYVKVRDAISCLSDYHFPATQKSAIRLKKILKNHKNIFLVGVHLLI